MEIYKFKNDDKIIIDYETATIKEIILDNENIIHGNIPLFLVKLRKKDNSTMYVSAKECYYAIYNEGAHHYHYDFFDLSLYVKQVENGLSFKVSIINYSDFLIEQVELMSFGVNAKLSEEEDGVGEIIIPYNEGALVKNMQKRESNTFHYREADYPSLGIYYVFPNMLCSQFMAYGYKNKGIYLGMHDPSRTPKHLDFKYEDNAIKLQLRTFTNCDYGQDYNMDFPCLLLIYEGDYYETFDIYRNWFKSHLPEGLKTIEEKYNEFPSWYHDSPLIITYPICGTKDSDKVMAPGKLYPYTNGLKVIDYFANKIDSKVMALLMQWESTAPWAPPYVWPPYGDINDFNNFVTSLHNNGHYIGLYTSGFGWTNQSFRRDYNKEEEFNNNNLASIMCSNSDGYITSTVVTDIRKGYDLCPSQKKSQELIINETNKMINANVDYIQVLDQNHGGCSYFCYSDKHGHIPAPGKWQINAVNNLLEQIELKNCLLGCESAASEPFIKNLSFSDNRLILNQYVGEAIPLYSYIYHEYVNNFMGNGICNVIQNHEYSMPYRLAYSFLCGDLLALVIDDEGKIHTSWCIDDIVDEEIPLSFIKTLMSYRKDTYYGKFLHMGKMIKPIKFQCEDQKFDNELYGFNFIFPSVLSSAYMYRGENIQFLVNYTLKTQEITFENEQHYFKEIKQEKAYISKTIKLDPLSVIVIKKQN